jgi:uncharacterized protein YndB with AHSA1/START domain
MIGTRATHLFVSVPSARMVVLTRTFKAPRHRLFAALTEPNHMRHWLPLGSLEQPTFELRADGSWSIAPAQATPQPFKIEGSIRGMVWGHHIAFTVIVNRWLDHRLLVNMRFDEHGDRTTVTATLDFETTRDRDTMLDSQIDEILAECLDSLTRYLAPIAQ